jgi:1-acyl-sn-glycerol-3-phosphate acyltransferase
MDTAATKSAIRSLREGAWVGMLPEGRINMGEELMLPGRPGAVVIALKAKAPILPCFIYGSPYDRTPWSPLFMSARAELRVGEMIDLSDYQDRVNDRELVAELMLRCLRAMAKLAGRPDFEPQLAGRQWLPDKEANPLQRQVVSRES